MAVTKCKYSRKGMKATSDERGQVSHTLSFEVETDSLMAPAAVGWNCRSVSGSDNFGGAVGDIVPDLWTAYSYNGWTDATSFARHHHSYPRHEGDSPYLWTVDVSYEPLKPGEQSTTASTNPLARPPRVWLESEVYTEVLEEDRSQTPQPILNSAGQQFDDVIEEPAARSVLVIQFSVSNLATVALYTSRYQYSVNQSAVTILGATFQTRQLYCRSVTSTPLLTEGATSYFDMTFRLSIHEDEWKRKILNRGFKHKQQVIDENQQVEEKLVNATEPILDEDGKETGRQQVTEPVLLADNGYKLSYAATEPTYKTFYTQRQVNYNQAPFNAAPFV